MKRKIYVILYDDRPEDALIKRGDLLEKMDRKQSYNHFNYKVRLDGDREKSYRGFNAIFKTKGEARDYLIERLREKQDDALELLDKIKEKFGELNENFQKSNKRKWMGVSNILAPF